jgi:hypothetical protein
LTVAIRKAAAGRLDLALQLEPRDIALQHKQDKWECRLDIWLVQLDHKEHHLNTDARTNNLALDRLFGAIRERSAVVVHGDGAEMLLRILVRDVASGALGSVTVPLQRFTQQ